MDDPAEEAGSFLSPDKEESMSEQGIGVREKTGGEKENGQAGESNILPGIRGLGPRPEVAGGGLTPLVSSRRKEPLPDGKGIGDDY